MKKFLATYAMAAVAAVLAGYTYWEYQHSREDSEAAKGERLAFTLKREDIDEIILTLRGEKTVLKRDGDIWRITEPVEDLTEGPAVEGYLYSLLAQRVKAFRGEEDQPLTATNWAEFGLEPPGSIVSLSSKGKSESVAVGTRKTFDGLFYVRQKDELLLGDNNLMQISERPASVLRSRHLWREDDGKISKLTIEYPGIAKDGKTVIVKDGAEWKMNPNPSFTFDPARFEGWVNKLEEFLPSDFVKEGLDEQLRHDGLLVKPSQLITIDYTKKDGTSAQWVLTLGQDRADEVFLFTNQRPTVYKTSRASVDPLRVDRTYFRNSRALFNFDVEQAREVRIVIPKFRHTFTKGDKGWSAESADLKLDQDKLVQLITVLHSLEAKEFVSGPGVGFNANSPRIEILGEKSGGGKDHVLYSMTWADEYKAKSPWNSSVPMRYVRTSGGSDTIGLEKSKLDRLIDPSLIKKAEAK